MFVSERHGDTLPADQSPDAVAKRQREHAAEAAAGDVEQAGQDLGSSAGEVTKDAETLLAAGQGQVAVCSLLHPANHRFDLPDYLPSSSKLLRS